MNGQTPWTGVVARPGRCWQRPGSPKRLPSILFIEHTFFGGILLVPRYTRQKLRLNKKEFAEVELLHLFMNRRSTLPLLCTATLLLVPLAISGRAQLAGKGEARLVAFQDPDPDSGVVDDSADYDVFYDRLSPDGN